MPQRLDVTPVILTPTQIAKAAEIVSNEWGANYSKLFMEESAVNGTITGSATYGLVSKTGDIVATGTIVKSCIDYALWGITWVVVDKELRGQGLGSDLTKTLIEHAVANKKLFPSEHAVIELTTQTPDYYTRFGFKVVTQWGTSNLMVLDTANYRE